MKRTYKTILQTGLSLLLCALMLAGVSPMASAAEKGTSPFDYSTSGAGSITTIDASDLLERFFGISATDAEKAYLNQASGLSLRYSDLIPSEVISTEYNGDTGTLLVSVPTYSYLAANGVRVEWVPTSACLEGKTETFSWSGSDYRCSFSGLLYSDDFDLSVSFAWSAEIGAEAADLLLTRPWTDGNEALRIIEAYERDELNPYLVALEAYNVYTAYLQAVADWEQYLLDKAQYDADLQKYNDYVKAFEEYSQRLAAYELRQKYEKDLAHYYAYQEFLANDLANYQAYLAYQNQMSEIGAKLDIMESMFTWDSNGWRLYGSMMGDTVTSVVDRRAELITAGCDPVAIENAGASTKELRVLLEGYSDLRDQTYSSEHERVRALYDYYTRNYMALRDQFGKLYGALKSLYGNEIVVIALIEKGKIDHFQQFVGQLYVIATCLDDTETGIRMANWTIGKKSLSQVVEPRQLLEDTGDSDPSGVLMPENEVARVEAVEPIEKPTVVPPVAPHPGNPPTEVQRPTAPTLVPEPDSSNPPPEAEHPGDAPAKPEMHDSLWNLALAIRQGTVQERTARGESRTLTLEKTVTCPISIHNLKTVTFYDVDGETVLWRTKVDYGGSVTYQGPSMKREEPNYTYEFLGWVLADGAPADYSVITSNLSVYANYRITPAYYTVTWVLDGVTKVTSCAYGMIPECPFSLTKADTVEQSYTFSGWNTEVKPVTGNVTYMGSFVASPRLYTVTWILGDRRIEQQVPYGSYPVFPEGVPTSYADERAYYQLQGWNKSLDLPIHSDVTYMASYTGRMLAMSGSGGILSATHEEDRVILHAEMEDVFLSNLVSYAQEHQKDLCIQWDLLEITIRATDLVVLQVSECSRINLKASTPENGQTLYTVMLANSMGEDVGLLLPLFVRADALSSSGERYLFRTEDGKVTDGTEGIAFESLGGFSLGIDPIRSISVEHNDYCYTTSLTPYAVPGAWVSFGMTCEFGYAISGATVTLADGTPVAADKTGFFMPDGDVHVVFEVTKIVYRVLFMVNGEVYHTAEYFLGEHILLPEDPSLSDDATYSYTFSKWDPAVTIAMGEERELVFSAVFSKTLLQGEDPYTQDGNNNRLLTVFLPILLAVIVLGGVGALLLLRRKRRAQKTEETEETEEIEKRCFLSEWKDKLLGLLKRWKKD